MGCGSSSRSMNGVVDDGDNGVILLGEIKRNKNDIKPQNEQEINLLRDLNLHNDVDPGRMRERRGSRMTKSTQAVYKQIKEAID